MPADHEFRPGDPVAIVPSRWTGRDGARKTAHGTIVGRHDEVSSNVDFDFGPYGQLRLPIPRKYLAPDPAETGKEG